MKTLENKIKYRVKRSKESVFMPQDFIDLSDRNQIGRALRKLVIAEILIKIGSGLYAKARRSPYSGNIVLEKGLSDLAKEALFKLGVPVVQSRGQRNYNKGKSSQVPTGRVIGVKSRVSRRIGYNGKYVTFEYSS